MRDIYIKVSVILLWLIYSNLSAQYYNDSNSQSINTEKKIQQAFYNDRFNQMDDSLLIKEKIKNPYTSARRGSGILFILSYSATVIVSAAVFHTPYEEMYIPLAGPFLVLANKRYNLGQYEGLVWLSALGQTVSCLMYAALSVSERNWEIGNERIGAGIDLIHQSIYARISL